MNPASYDDLVYEIKEHRNQLNLRKPLVAQLEASLAKRKARLEELQLAGYDGSNSRIPNQSRVQRL